MGDTLTRFASRVVLEELPVHEMCLRIDAHLRRELPYDVAAWSTHDPASGLITSCTLTGIPEDPSRESTIFRNEFREGEPATYLGLIREGRTSAILTQETDGQLERAGRYREVFSHFGVSDELRTILWAEGQAWGSVSLYRTGGAVFTDTEADVVAAVAPVVADGIRLGLLRAAASRPEALDDPPGIVEVSTDGDVVPATEPARRWLDVGGAALASAARIAAAAVREHREWDAAASRFVAPGGRILALRAASTTRDDGSVAVIVEAARRAQVGPLLVDAYGLTDRQRDVLGLLLLGRSMAQIAGELEISEHTANDHRKAIYRRVGVNSRSELAALLQTEQYDPRARGGVPPSPYGGFLER